MSADTLPIVAGLRDAIHECAPDHSQHIISVGECRQAAGVIEALYDATRMARAALWAIDDSAVESGFGKLSDILSARIAQCNAALELAEGEQ